MNKLITSITIRLRQDWFSELRIYIAAQQIMQMPRDTIARKRGLNIPAAEGAFQARFFQRFVLKLLDFNECICIFDVIMCRLCVMVHIIDM